MRIQAALLALICSGAGQADVPEPPVAVDSFVAGAARAATAAGGELAALDPALRKLLAPMVASWIADTRDAVVVQGVAEIPPEIRAALTGFVPPEMLDRVRWRVDDGLLATLESLFGAGYVSAVTLDHVVLFANVDDAKDPLLWAHEIFHVMQYGEWGVEEFVARYLADYAAVEEAAWAFRWQWVEATRQLRAVPRATL